MNDIILEIFADRVNNFGRADCTEIDEIIANEVRKSVGEKISINQSIRLTEKNYRRILHDPEIRSIFRSTYILSKDAFKHIESILFLLPVIESGYNFGQYRIASHLVSIGIPREKLFFFPLFIIDNKYHYKKEELIHTLHMIKPQFVGEIGYLGWEKELYDINQLIRSEIHTNILLGGPLTSSHLAFCVNRMEADVIMVGHGEYLLEEYFLMVGEQKNLSPMLDIDDVFYKNQKVSQCSPYTNKYLDRLHWDMPVLDRFCRIAPVINLFTSDVCYGNCIFCYRTNAAECRYMSQSKLIERLKEIVDYFSIRQDLDIKYIRFYDDDFFAASERKIDCLQQIKKVIKGHFRLYELQASIRSICKANIDELTQVILELEVQRVTIGVDGYNDQDLLFLQKGYTIKQVFETIGTLSNKKIPCLLYAILTTYVTTCCSLNKTFLNMIHLVLLGQVYIGPSISPVISVASNNKKLYPNFTGEKFCFLKVDSVSDLLVKGNKPENIVMRADLLPQNRIVRTFIQKHNFITTMQSAYILPLVADFYQFLAVEYNWLFYAKDHLKEVQLKLKNENIRLRKVEKKYCEALYSGKKFQATIDNINNLNNVRREIIDNLDKQQIVNDETTICAEIQIIQSIIFEYVQMFDSYFDKQNANNFSAQLSQCIKRLLPVPILAFDAALTVNSREIKDIYEHILKVDFILNDEEVDLFQDL